METDNKNGSDAKEQLNRVEEFYDIIEKYVQNNYGY